MLPGNADPGLNPPRGRENLQLKIVGIVLIIVASPAFAFLSSQRESKALLYASKWQLALITLLFLGASNIATLGLIFFLAGLRDIALLTKARARKGMWVKLAGANLLIVCFGVVALFDSGLIKESWMESGIGLVLFAVAMVLFVVLTRKGVVLFRKGWKYDALPADELLQEDARRPVVYVRSFKEDDKIFLKTGRFRWTSHLMYAVAISAEQELALIMNRVGPVIAIGKPGEPVPELGAARLYARDDEWRKKITDLMKRARLVVVRAGATANLQWEIDQAVELLPLRQLILVAFGQGEEMEAFDEEIERRFGRPETIESPPRSFLLRWMKRLKFRHKNLGKIIFFSEDSRPYVEPIQSAPTWGGFLLFQYRPYWDPLAGSFRRVFKHLQLPWVEHRNKIIAALLALFIGMFGLHHFYLGNKRRGLYYLGFFLTGGLMALALMKTIGERWLVLSYLVVCWTFAPLIMSWIDAVKFMRTGKEDFDRRFVHH